MRYICTIIYLSSYLFIYFLGWLQFQRESEVSTRDESLYLFLDREDGQPVLQENETNC